MSRHGLPLPPPRPLLVVYPRPRRAPRLPLLPRPRPRVAVVRMRLAGADRELAGRLGAVAIASAYVIVRVARTVAFVTDNRDVGNAELESLLLSVDPRLLVLSLVS